MFPDYILNGRGFGEVGEALSAVRCDPGLKRPFFDKKGRACVIVNTRRTDKEGHPIYQKILVREALDRGLISNATTTMLKDEWLQIDSAIIGVMRDELIAWSDLMASSTLGGFNAMGKSLLEWQTKSDPGEAFVDMDATTEGRNFASLYGREAIPLPITHSDFFVTERELQISRNGRMPLDTDKAEAAGRRIAEKIEDTVIGTATGISFGDATGYSRVPTVYGYLNHPNRYVSTAVTAPTGGWTPSVLVGEIIAILNHMAGLNYRGPWMMYTSLDWEVKLDNDYSASYAGGTLRNRIRQIGAIKDVRTLQRLNVAGAHPYTILLVMMTKQVATAINGMTPTTLQWSTQGGLRHNFKVMAIQVPLIRADYNGNTGVVQAAPA